MSVITTFEFQNPVSIRRRSRDAQSAHHCFSSGRDEAQHRDPRQTRSDPFSEFKRIRFAGAETPGNFDRFAHRFAYIWIAMTEHQRTKALAEVDVVAAIDRSHRSALRAAEEDRSAAHAFEGAHGTVHAAGRDPSGAIEVFAREIVS